MEGWHVSPAAQFRRTASGQLAEGGRRTEPVHAPPRRRFLFRAPWLIVAWALSGAGLLPSSIPSATADTPPALTAPAIDSPPAEPVASESPSAPSPAPSTNGAETDAVAKLLTRLLKENEDLRVELEGPSRPRQRMEQVTTRAAELAAERARFQQRYNHLRGVGDLTEALGLLLQRYRDELPDADQHRRRIASRRGEVATVRRRLLDLEIQQSDLRDLDSQVSLQLAKLPLLLFADRPAAESAVRTALTERNELLGPLIRDYRALFDAMVLDLDRNELELVRESESLAAYIDERILWLPSSPPLGPSRWNPLVQAAGWLFDPSTWQRWGELWWLDMWGQLPLYVVTALAVGVAVALRRRLRHQITGLAEPRPGERTPRVGRTVAAIFLSALIALVGPAVIWFLAWRVDQFAGPADGNRPLSTALQSAAIAWLMIDWLRQIARKNGLAEGHFGVDPQQSRIWRRDLWLLLIVAVPWSFFTGLCWRHELIVHQPGLGELGFIGGLLLLSGVAWRTLSPRYGVLPVLDDSPDAPLRHWLRKMIQPIGVGLPFVLAAITAWGYGYTALVLFLRLILTLWFIFLLRLVRNLLWRWLNDAQQLVPDPQRAAEHQAQTRRMLYSLSVLAFIAGGWWIWEDVMPALRALDRWQVFDYGTFLESGAEGSPAAAPNGGPTPLSPSATSGGNTRPLTAGDLVIAAIVFIMTFIAHRNLPGLLEMAWFQNLPLDAGGRYALTSLSRYLILMIGGGWLFRTLGFTWTSVQWLVAAISVGLGFGLQEIFANFVAGLIVLFERPMRVGDIITIGGISGTVTRIRARATSIIDFDRKELIVPNKDFITGRLVNWTLSDSILRVVIKVGVAYGSDPEQVVEALLTVARENSTVLKYPPPQAIMVGFGASSLDFELRAFVPSADRIVPATHSLNVAIERKFRELGLEIPFAQTDVHLRSLPPGTTRFEVESS